MLKLVVKTIAHGMALSHRPRSAETWGRTTAYRRSGTADGEMVPHIRLGKDKISVIAPAE